MKILFWVFLKFLLILLWKEKACVPQYLWQGFKDRIYLFDEFWTRYSDYHSHLSLEFNIVSISNSIGCYCSISFLLELINAWRSRRKPAYHTCAQSSVNAPAWPGFERGSWRSGSSGLFLRACCSTSPIQNFPNSVQSNSFNRRCLCKWFITLLDILIPQHLLNWQLI